MGDDIENLKEKWGEIKDILDKINKNIKDQIGDNIIINDGVAMETVDFLYKLPLNTRNFNYKPRNHIHASSGTSDILTDIEEMTIEEEEAAAAEKAEAEAAKAKADALLNDRMPKTKFKKFRKALGALAGKMGSFFHRSGKKKEENKKIVAAAITTYTKHTGNYNPPIVKITN